MFRTETNAMKLILHRLQGHSPTEQSLNLFFTTLSITRRALRDSTLVPQVQDVLLSARLFKSRLTLIPHKKLTKEFVQP